MRNECQGTKLIKLRRFAKRRNRSTLQTLPALHLVALWRCCAVPEPRATLMKNTQLLLINDMCGYGKVALSAMLPVLSHMGYRIHNLPTALVSDTLNYPKF